MQYSTYNDLLVEQLELRKQLNPSYSLRAFSRDLGISPSTLSSVLKRKRGISVAVAEKIATKLKLSKEQKDWFCASVGSVHSRSFKERKRFDEIIFRSKSASQNFSEIQLEFFKVISVWHHFAILELTYLKDFQNNLSWISKRLGISKNEVKEAIKRMKDLKLLEEKNGKLKDVFKFLATPSDTPSSSLKRFNSQLLNLANKALLEQSVDNREIASNIIAINKDNIPEIKEEIREFRRKLEFKVSKDNNKNSVYCLSTQFFELTK